MRELILATDQGHTKALNDFRQRYALRESLINASPQESLQLGPSDGLRILDTAPASIVEFGWPPESRGEPGKNRHLWVIDDRGVPYLLETYIPILGSSLPKHTNLTAGLSACIGGELWFISKVSISVSGGSGRFPPLDEDQLAAAIEVFKSYEYNTVSLGWDTETGFAKRFLE